MSSGGGLFEGAGEGIGISTGMSIMCRKYPEKLRTWLGQVEENVAKKY